MSALKYFVYILQSTKTGLFYIGQTQNLEKRFTEHNSGKSKYTANHTPWNLIWCTQVQTRKEAFHLERKLKSFKSRVRIIKYIMDNQVGEFGNLFGNKYINAYICQQK